MKSLHDNQVRTAGIESTNDNHRLLNVHEKTKGVIFHEGLDELWSLRDGPLLVTLMLFVFLCWETR